MRFLADVNMPLPAALQTASDVILATDVHRLFQNGLVDIERLRALTNEAQARNLLGAEFSYTVKTKLEWMMAELAQNPDNLLLLRNLEEVARQVVPIPVGLNLADVQNAYFEMSRGVLPQFQRRAAAGEQIATEWIQHFLELGRCLEFAVDQLKHDIEHQDHGDHRKAA
jgi:hypothetical protein